MKLWAPQADSPRILPVVMLGLVILIGFRAGNLWIGFSDAGAAESMAFEAAEEGAAGGPPSGRRDRGVVDERILQHLSERRAELDARDAALSTREAVLSAAEARIDARLLEIAKQEERLIALAAAGEANMGKEIARLSDAYERMKPRDAARIFEALDSKLLADVAAGMRTQSLAAVLGEMDAAKAKALTELLARRRGQSDAGGSP